LIMKFELKPAAMAGLAALIALSACARDDQLVLDQGVGVTASRGICPVIAVPAYTGDVTIFNPANSRDASAIDVVATITNMRDACSETGEQLYASADFDVNATRMNTQGAREVVLPYFSTVLRGGSAVVSKRVGQVTLRFADGQARASATAKAGAYINRSAATLPDDIRDRITQRRKAGDQSAAIDPLSTPEVRAAIARTSFELLVGFQLTEDQLAYNVTR